MIPMFILKKKLLSMKQTTVWKSSSFW